MPQIYYPNDWGDDELIIKFRTQVDDAKRYFISAIKPRLDRAYKLYISYNGDRAQEIKSWQSNIFVPYTQGVIETLMPRILDARPDFTCQGRTPSDQNKSSKQQQLMDYQWESASMDSESELVTRAALIYGTGFMQVSWKKDVRTQKFLKTKNLSQKRLSWEKREQVFFDGPVANWVDNYSLWYDWHNIERENKQYWFRRLLLPGSSVKRRYPLADKERLNMALSLSAPDDSDYGKIRQDVKLAHDRIVKGSDYHVSTITEVSSTPASNYSQDSDLRIHEVFEWWRPFEDAYAVMINNVPIFPKGQIPIPFDFKEAPFIDVPYLRLPNEFEGYGLPLILESPQIMLNMIKNQRLDNATLSIHKMWVVNPLANVKKEELVTRPFGIIYSPDPNGVKEIQFSDIKQSAYKEEELLKSDMRYASGVDDFSMGTGGSASSATEVRHLRESTLERVRLFVNHLGDAYARIMRYWMSMNRQFFTKKMQIRLIGEEGEELFPIVEKDDLYGTFDYKATVIPSIAGMNEVKKKQDMDLFQLLINLPFVDPRKLTAKVLYDWEWDIDSIAKEEEPMVPGMGMEPGMEGAVPGMVPGMEGLMAQQGAEQSPLPPVGGSGEIPSEVIQSALALIGGGPTPGGFQQASSPINLLQQGGMPPTVPGVPLPTTNPRGMNRTGRVNTNVSTNQNATPEGSLMNRTFNLQR